MWDHQNPHSDFRLFRPRQLPPLETTGGIVIPYADTPNADDTIGADLYLQMISKAKRYLYIWPSTRPSPPPSASPPGRGWTCAS